MRHVLCCTLLLAAAGCFPDPKCDPDQVTSHSLCVDVPGDPAPRPDAGDGDAGAGQDGAAAASMGRACATIDECGADTDLCAMVPGASSGFCTRSGCVADPSMCPAGWTCFDASAYVAGMSLCIAQ